MLRGVLGPCLLFALCLPLICCGRPGDPLPPFIRIPESVNDLGASQQGYDLILTWTNPARNIDGSAAADLKRIHIFSNGVPLATVNVTASGERQSYIVPARPLVGMTRTFAVQVETSAEKSSGTSNNVSITAVHVPGRVTALRPLVDQNRITLEWDLPIENPDLADAYIVSEMLDNGEAEDSVVLSERSYQDERYEVGSTYTYTVTAVSRAGPTQVPGLNQTIEVVATDRSAPQPPTGLEIVPSDAGAFLTWMGNLESDLAGYRVFRSERPEAGFELLTEDVRTTTGIFDTGYRRSLYYAVSAVDESGNESPRSAAYRAP